MKDNDFLKKKKETSYMKDNFASSPR